MTPDCARELRRILDPSRTMPPLPEESYFERKRVKPSLTLDAVERRKAKVNPKPKPKPKLPEYTIEQLQAALDRHGGVIKYAARELGRSSDYLEDRIKDGRLVKRGRYMKLPLYDLAALQAALDRHGGVIRRAAADVGCDVHTYSRHLKSGKLVRR